MNRDQSNIVGIALTVAMGGFLLGFDATVISGVIPFLREHFQLNGPTNAFKVGFAVSCLGWGAMAGNLSAGVLSDRYGRRALLRLTALVFLGSAIAAALAPTFTAFVIARISSGLAVGAAILTAPVYIAEISPAARRGSLVSLNQLMIVIGISVSFFSNYLLLLALQADSWRWMLGVQAIPALLFLLLLLRVPESPRWLLGRGRVQEARAVLTALHGPADAERQLAEIASSVGGSSLWSRIGTVFTRRMQFVMLFALGIAFFQQATGINAIFYYLPIIFARTGGGLASAFGQAVVVGLVNVAMTFVAIRLIDRMGRRPLLIAGLAGMATSLLAISWAFHPAGSAGGPMSSGNALLVLVAIIGFVASFAASLGPVMWVMLAEIFPNEQRATAIALVGFWNSLVSATVTFLFQWELDTYGPSGVFLVFGLLAVAGLLFVSLIAPETKGKTLEQLEGALLRPARAA